MTPQLVSGLLFLVIFIIILSERMHRTIIALFGAVLMVAVGMAMNFYSQAKAGAAIDFNTLGLLMGMMILVNMLKKTGFFEYLAIVTAKSSRGSPLILLILLGSITTVVSMFLDNVTTVVLILPVTLIITQILGYNPIPYILAEVILSNVGGTGTLIGDPPNIIIGSAAGFSFNDFLIHLLPVVLVAWAVTLALLIWLFRQEMLKKSHNVHALMALDEKTALKDQPSLFKILFSLGVVIVLFFLHGVFHYQAAFVALLGAAIAMILVRPDPEEILKDVEWPVLVFFGSLFVLVGGMEASGLLEQFAHLLGSHMSSNILVSIVIIIWVSAILSAVVDNIPFTVAMVPVIKSLESQGLPVEPLWWALAIGVGFGGNGSPVGATANVIAMAMSQKTEHPITLKVWMKTAGIITLATCLVATLCFLLIYGLLFPIK